MYMRFPDISTEAGKIRREKLQMDPYVMKRGTREILYIDFRYAGGVYVKFSNSAYPLEVHLCRSVRETCPLSVIRRLSAIR